jgi:uncharacterized protein YqiB (DUF1249 family)
MLLDHQLVPQTIVRPNSFVGLMSLYESNYLRILQLIPEIDRLDGCFRSRVAEQCDLHVEIIERCRYTVTLHERELSARWKRNIMLNKWLEYLSDQGHLILER